MIVKVDYDVEIINSDGISHCFIPAIDTYFSCKNPDDVEQRAIDLIKIWTDHFNVENGSNESKEFFNVASK